jgi:5'(3')-deoxyribonucleotidase
MKQKIIYIDLDDTIADFISAATVNGVFDYIRMYEPGFFFSLKPIDGSLVAVRQLIALGYDVQILSQPVADSAHSYYDKIRWIGCYFPELLHKINFTQDKGLFKGDYLIDDNINKWADKFEANGGRFIHFMYNPGTKTQFSNKEMWERIVNFFKAEVKRDKEKESAKAQSEREDDEDGGERGERT